MQIILAIFFTSYDNFFSASYCKSCPSRPVNPKFEFLTAIGYPYLPYACRPKHVRFLVKKLDVDCRIWLLSLAISFPETANHFRLSENEIAQPYIISAHTEI